MVDPGEVPTPYPPGTYFAPVSDLRLTHQLEGPKDGVSEAESIKAIRISHHESPAASVPILLRSLFTMRLSATLVAALTAASADALVTRALIDKCLTDSGVPVDVPGTADYKRDVAPFNIRLPYTPTAISVPQTIEHIQKSVQCGKKLGIKVSAKSGGHSYASFGFGGEDGHLVVQLDRMYNVTVDKRTKIATVQPGARLGHVASVLSEEYGRAIAHGTCPQ